MKISLSDLRQENKTDYIVSHFITKNQRKGFSVVFVESVIGHYKTKLKEATRLYFVIEGEGKFIIDEQTYTASKYDLFIIDSMAVYEYRGTMKMIEFNIPATDVTNYEKVL